MISFFQNDFRYGLKCKLNFIFWQLSYIHLFIFCFLSRAKLIKHKFVFSIYIRNVGMFASFNWILYIGILCEKWKVYDYTVLFKDSIYVSDNLHSKTNWASGILLEKYSDHARKVSNFRISNPKSLPCVSFEIDNMDLTQANQIFFGKFEISPQVQDLVDFYLDSVLPDNFYSVHIRGTDKYLEAPAVEDEKIIDCLRRLVDLNQDFEFNIFLASDEISIITKLRELIQNAFPKSSIFFLTDFSRSVSGFPLHLDRDSCFIDKQKHTVEALIECLVLSKSTVLIKNASCFSGWASVLNPDLKVVMLNAPYESNDWFPDKYIRANQFLIE